MAHQILLLQNITISMTTPQFKGAKLSHYDYIEADIDISPLILGLCIVAPTLIISSNKLPYIFQTVALHLFAFNRSVCSYAPMDRIVVHGKENYLWDWCSQFYIYMIHHQPLRTRNAEICIWELEMPGLRHTLSYITVKIVYFLFCRLYKSSCLICCRSMYVLY